MTDSLRTRIERARSLAGQARYLVSDDMGRGGGSDLNAAEADEAAELLDQATDELDAILAALPEAGRDEVAGFIYTEECPGGGSQYDWNEAARQADFLLSRYHLIRKADNDDD